MLEVLLQEIPQRCPAVAYSFFPDTTAITDPL
jgi:hypothetical protein